MIIHLNNPLPSAKQDYQAMLYGARLGWLRRWRVAYWARRTGRPMPFVRPEPPLRYEEDNTETYPGIWWRATLVLAVLWVLCSVAFGLVR